MNLAIDLLGEYSDKTADRVEKLENQIDQYEDALGTYLVKLRWAGAFDKRQPGFIRTASLYR